VFGIWAMSYGICSAQRVLGYETDEEMVQERDLYYDGNAGYMKGLRKL
jgi:hypothetical protein